MMSEESIITMPPKEMKEWNEKNGEEKTSSPTNKLEKHPYEEGLNGVVGKSTMKAQACCGLM